METLNKKKIDESYKRIQSVISKTPLITNETINKIAKANVFFKLENLQYTGSFKIRGASNKISKLSEEDKSKGIVAYSSGNHAQAVSYVSKLYGINSTIVMPKNAPKNKIENTKKYGSKVIFGDFPYKWEQKILDVHKKLDLDMAAYDIAWDNDNTDDEPYFLEVSPRFSPNPNMD